MKTSRLLPALLCALMVALSATAQNLPQGPECPELMSLKPMEVKDDATDRFMEKTAWELVFKTPAQVKDFAAKLCARAKWDKQIFDEMVNGQRPEDEELAKRLTEERKNFVTFMLKLGIIAERHTNVRMKKTSQGAWTYSLTPLPQFETTHWLSQVPTAKKKENMNGYAACYYKDAYYFCERPLGGGLVPIVLDDDEMYVANVAFVLIRNIGIIYENGAMAILQEWYPDEKDRFELTYQTCLLYLDSVSKAMENNDKIEIQYEPMPKAGALNASMKAKVLPLEKAVTDAVVDCVVTSDSWEVQKDAAGNIVRRVIYGYSIVQTKRGKSANRVSWAEDYQGGSYGPVHCYGVGGSRFYVK